ncbi:hypothetical protein CTI12_AA469790 [Artemisia annua]|uniref:Uncharacterized protein n=1 Tax=Artemisia annua TaxID=35608 RepID=A0A2U1LP39_ARTAN|nr:hypothetical protein CTI12_AA469790 [Artemisia annua]
MNGKELLTNIIALDILVITLIVNVCIQMKTNVVFYWEMALFYGAMLLILLIIHTCSGLTILKSKQILELKYQAGHETALKDLELQQPGRLTAEKLNQHVKNHWIMAGTGSPQFITACSATTSASGCIRSLVGTIAPLCRCYASLSFKLSIKWIWNHIKSSIPFSASSRKIKIVIQNFKVLFLIICIGLQKIVVVACKMIALIPIFFVICVLFFIRCWKWFKAMFSASSIVMVQNPEQQENFNDLRQYVLQLQDDMELSERTLKSISKSVNRLIKKAEKQQPSNLVKLLRESKGFEGVGKYDSLHVPPLFAEDCLDCWSLSLVTLTAIAVSLPEIQNDRVDRLLSSVSEGLTYVTLVEESLNATDKYVNTQKAAKVLWLEVEVSNKWVENNLKNHAPEVNTAGLILQCLYICIKLTKINLLKGTRTFSEAYGVIGFAGVGSWTADMRLWGFDFACVTLFRFGAMRVNKFDVEDNLETIEPVGFVFLMFSDWCHPTDCTYIAVVIVSSHAGHSVRPLIYGVKLTHKCGSLWEWYVLMKQADIVGCGYLILPKALPAFYVKIRQAQSTCSWFGPLITPQTLGESMTVYMGNVRASGNVHENDDAGDLPSVPIPAIEDTTAPRAPVYALAEKPTSRVSSSTAEFLKRSMPEPSCGGAPSTSTSHRTTPTCSGPPAEYRAFKSCECVCSNCHARFCYEDRLSNSIRR